MKAAEKLESKIEKTFSKKETKDEIKEVENKVKNLKEREEVDEHNAGNPKPGPDHQKPETNPDTTTTKEEKSVKEKKIKK